MNERFHTRKGGGVTLVNLFAGWPRDRLAIVSHIAGPPDWERCAHYYRIGRSEYKWRWPLGSLNTASHSGPVLDSTCPGARAPQGTRRSTQVKMTPIRHVVGVAHRLLGGPEPFMQITLSQEFLQWVERFDPDIIYGQFSDLNSCRFLSHVAQTLQKAYVVHLMDDWIDCAYSHGLLAPFLARRFAKEARDLLARADVALGICQAMCDAYEAKYGRPFLPFHNPVDLTAWHAVARSDWASGRPFHMRYGGRIGWSIEKSLLSVCAAVDSLRHCGHDIVLDVYSPEHEHFRALSAAFLGVTTHPMQPRECLPTALASADLLLICYDFDAQSKRMSRYSMPTKTAECMASGTPVLVYGPAEIPVVHYARESGWAYVLSCPDPSALQEAILRLALDASLRENLGRRAMSLAVRNHDAVSVRRAFQQLLCSVAQGNEERGCISARVGDSNGR